MNLLRSIKDWQNRRRINTEERRRSQRSTFSFNHPGAIHPILQIVLLQNSQRSKEFNKFCPLNKSDDLLPFLMYLSFFYDLAGNYFYTICCELRNSGLRVPLPAGWPVLSGHQEGTHGHQDQQQHLHSTAPLRLRNLQQQLSKFSELGTRPRQRGHVFRTTFVCFIYYVVVVAKLNNCRLPSSVNFLFSQIQFIEMAKPKRTAQMLEDSLLKGTVDREIRKLCMYSTL